MCGIAGLWNIDAKEPPTSLHKKALQMASSLEHRGPDEENVWISPLDGVALAHRRLRIIDLSSNASQPMISYQGQGVLVYNGEIYNFLELQDGLEKEGVTFSSNSDSRVLVEALCLWGIEKTIPLLSGMFAFAFWDKRNKSLTLVRDRFGVKPLYWGKDPTSSSIFFGSEIKAFHAVFPTFSILNSAVSEFFQQGYISSPHTIYNDIYKLEPGTYLTIRSDGTLTHHTYWSTKQVIASSIAKRNASSSSLEDIIEEGHSLLKKSVKKRLVADVPVGAFLSGGIDSSLVVALAQACSSNSLKTFSIGFEEESYNEATFARKVAHHLGTTHTEVFFTSQDLLPLLPHLSDIYDEPFADSSALPTILVSQITKKEVTVSLSGDGGDEVFGGYRRYIWAEKYWPFLKKIPLPLRLCLAKLGTKIPLSIYDKISSLFPPTLQLQDKIEKGLSILKTSSIKEYYVSIIQSNCPFLCKSGTSFPTYPLLENATNLDLLQYWDIVSYLPDDILCKVDRASMSQSLEAREPLLDHELFSYAWTLPQKLKIQNNQSKVFLREILKNYFPSSFFDRPKVGFGIPLDAWLRGIMYPWANEHLCTLSPLTLNFVDRDIVYQLWQSHLSGKSNQGLLLWRILMFDAWAKKRSPFIS